MILTIITIIVVVCLIIWLFYELYCQAKDKMECTGCDEGFYDDCVHYTTYSKEPYCQACYDDLVADDFTIFD